MRDVGFLRGFFYLIQFIMRVLRSRRTHYYKCLIEYKDLLDSGIHIYIEDFCDYHCLSNDLPTILKEIGVITIKEGSCIWIGDYLSVDLVGNIIYKIMVLQNKRNNGTPE